MKSIEEAAGELYRQHHPTPSVIYAFCEGAKFAQQWYSVHDVLPKENVDVIVKARNNGILIARLFAKKWWEVKLPNQKYKTLFSGVDLWRPISIE